MIKAFDSIPGGYGWVTLMLLVNVMLNIWMAMQVLKARKRYNVPYPALYAVESENKEAKLFNCVQRGHQNFVEFMPTFVSLLLVGGLQFPKVAGALGLLYNIGRYCYFQGYSTGDPSKRMSGGGGLHFLALFGLFCCSTAFTFHQFKPDFVFSFPHWRL